MKSLLDRFNNVIYSHPSGGLGLFTGDYKPIDTLCAIIPMTFFLNFIFGSLKNCFFFVSFSLYLP